MSAVFPGHLSEHRTNSADDAALALLGKKQVLERRFSFISTFGFAVCELITWETVLALFSETFENGGPAGAIYGYIIAWSSTLSVYIVISETASLAPIAGGQYYWVYMLAPDKYKTISSYVVGWLTSLAWIATVATETLFAGLIMQGIMVLDNPSYEGTQWQGTLLTWTVILGCILINTVIPSYLPKFEVFILVCHLAGSVAIAATLWAMTPSIGSNASVWWKSLNQGGWPMQGLSYCVGFLGNVATFVGADASVHLAEEVSDARRNIPRAILGAMLMNGGLGFITLVTVLYCLGEIEKVLDTATGFPFIQVFRDSVGNIAGATFMAALVLCLTWACAIGITTTASRMTWSFARDNGLPASGFLSKVDKRTKVPVNAVLTVTAIAALLTLIYVGSSTAFNDVISLTISGFYSSYLLPAALLLYHRIKGNVAPFGTEAGSEDSPEMTDGFPRQTLDDSSQITSRDKHTKDTKDITPSSELDVDRGTIIIANARLIWGPYRLDNWFGIVNNAYACLYMIFVIFWSVWPPSTPVTASTMNYSVLVTGGVLLLCTIYYVVRAKKKYKGPTIDREVAAIMRAGSVVSVS